MKIAKTCCCTLAVTICVASRAAVVDLGGATVNKNASEFTAAFKDNEIQNGTVNLSEGLWSNVGTYTIGTNATVICGQEQSLTYNYNLTIKNGGVYHQTANRFFIPFYYGTSSFTLDNGTLISDDGSNSNYSQAVNIGYLFCHNYNDSNGKNVTTKAVLTNGSTLSLTAGQLQFAGARKGANKKVNTSKTDFAVTNSTINVATKQIQLGIDQNSWMTDSANSYVKAIFGPGADITCKQIYAMPYPSPSVTFDGATVHWVEGGNSFIGHTTGVGDMYTIDSLGLTVDIPSGKALTCDSNASSLKGSGGITKIGDGSITWNRVSSNGSQGMTFTGPLVVSNGTWVSTLGYAASAFRADGGRLSLSGALTAANVALAATEGGTLTLAGATLTDASPDMTLAGGGTTDYFTRDGAVGSYSLDSLTLGEGAVLNLDADATDADTISATTTNITATAANPVTINLNFTTAPAPGQTFTFFATDDATKFTVVPKLSSLTIPHELSVVGGFLVMTVTAEDYIWNGTKTNWDDADAWTKGGANATWSDGNNAIFNAANATATLAADAAASKVEFTAEATVNGTATLTAPVVAVAPGVSATISAPIAGSLTKTGAGTLTLTSSRTSSRTTVSEGTLVMADGATIDPAKLTLGTDPAKPVTFDYDGKSMHADSASYLVAGMDVTLTNVTFSYTGDIDLGGNNLPATFTVAKNAELFNTVRFSRWNTATGGTNTFNLAGGTLRCEGTSDYWIMQGTLAGRLNFNVTDGGLVELGGSVRALTCRDAVNGSTDYQSPELHMNVVDSTLRLRNEKNLWLGYDPNTQPSATPTFVLAATNSVFDITGEIIVGNNATGLATGGSYTAEFVDCVVTTKNIRVYADRPLNRARFDGTTIAFTIDGTISAPDGDSKWITAGAGGLVLDTQAHRVSLGASIGGVGGLTVKGGGKVTMTVAPAYSGVTTVEVGTTLVIPSLDAFTGGFATTVATSAPLPEGAYPYIVIDGEGTLPASLLEDLVAPAGCRFVRTRDGKNILCISGNPTPTWIGGATGSLSVDANWSTGFVPDSGACVIGNATAANLEKGDTFAATSITFPADSAPVTIAGDFTTLASIVNRSSANMTFTGFVDFGANNINVTQTAAVSDTSTVAVSGGCVVFAGGVRGQDIENHAVLTGHYTLTKNDAFYAMSRLTVNTNSTLFVKKTDQIHELDIRAGATFTVESASHGWARDGTLNQHRLWCWNRGEFIATNYTFTGSNKMWLGGYLSTDNGRAGNVNPGLKIGTVNSTGSGVIWLHAYGGSETSSIHIGTGGIKLTSSGYVGIENSSHTMTLCPWNADYVIGRGSNANYDLRLATGNISLVLQTTDEGDTARTVTLNGRVSTEGHADTTITVKGAGTNVVNSASPLMVGTYAVTDTATVALNNGAGFANGTVSVGGTATLAVGESGTASVSNLTLAAGATLGFNFTERATAPVLVATSATLPATVKVKVSAADGKRAKGGIHVLTFGGAFTGANVVLAEGHPDWAKGVSVNADGNIVLDVKMLGTVVIVR